MPRSQRVDFLTWSAKIGSRRFSHTAITAVAAKPPQSAPMKYQPPKSVENQCGSSDMAQSKTTIVITAVYLFYDWPAWSLTLMSLAGLAVVGYLIYRRLMAPVRRVAEIKARQERQMSERRAAASPGSRGPGPGSG